MHTSKQKVIKIDSKHLLYCLFFPLNYDFCNSSLNGFHFNCIAKMRSYSLYAH